MVWAALSRAPRAIRLQFHEMAITFVTFYALISLCNEALLASCVSPRVDWSREQSSLVNQSTKANTAEGDGKVTASTHSFISPDVKEVHHQSQYTLIFSYFHTFILSYSLSPWISCMRICFHCKRGYWTKVTFAINQPLVRNVICNKHSLYLHL